MDLVACPEDILGHFRVPVTALMAEMDARLQHVFHAYSHGRYLFGLSLHTPQQSNLKFPLLNSLIGCCWSILQAPGSLCRCMCDVLTWFYGYRTIRYSGSAFGKAGGFIPQMAGAVKLESCECTCLGLSTNIPRVKFVSIFRNFRQQYARLNQDY